MSTSRFFTTMSVTALAVTLASTAVSLAAVPNAMAAPFGGPSAERHFTRAQMHGFPMNRGAAFDRSQHVEGRIAFLKAELKITDDQTPQWDAVAKAMRDQAAAMSGLRDEMRSEREKARADRDKGQAEGDRTQRRPALTAPQALELREKAITARTKALAVSAEGQRQFATAFRALYDRLTDDQKKAADQLLAGRRHRV